MRLFIGINFDSQTKQKLISLQEGLKKLGKGNFTHDQNLHLTLVFLGEVAPEGVAAIKGAMEQTQISPLTLRFDHMGCFKRDGGNIWWVGLGQNPALTLMQQALSSNLQGAGFTLERRRFTPHITLAREFRLSTEADPKVLLGQGFETIANTITLLRSERVGGKLVYTPIYELGKEGR